MLTSALYGLFIGVAFGVLTRIVPQPTGSIISGFLRGTARVGCGDLLASDGSALCDYRNGARCGNVGLPRRARGDRTRLS